MCDLRRHRGEGREQIRRENLDRCASCIFAGNDFGKFDDMSLWLINLQRTKAMDEKTEIENGHRVAGLIERVLTRAAAEYDLPAGACVGGAIEAAIRMARNDGMTDVQIGAYLQDLGEAFMKGAPTDIPPPSKLN
jgi:hypothetical protein